MPKTIALLPYRLRRIRKEKGLTLKVFAEAAGVTESALSLWERGKRYPRPDQLALLCKYLEMTEDVLVGQSGEGLVIRGVVEVGVGVQIGHYVTLDSDADGAKIVIGDKAVIGNGVIMTGDVEVGAGAVIGDGAILQPGARVSDEEYVRPGAVVGSPVYEQD